MYQLDPVIIRDLRERPAQALSEARHLSPMDPTVLQVADPFGQSFDVLARPAVRKSNNWAIWWSDLMMAMFVMFAALYIFQLPPKTRLDFVPEIPTQTEQHVFSGGESLLLRIYEQGREVISQNNLETFVAARLVPEKNMRFILAGEQIFAQGEAQLKGQAKSAVSVLAPILRQGPYKLTVVGHGSDDEDSVSGFSAPWDLSIARAKAVAEYLLEWGLPEAGMIVVGYGGQGEVSAMSNYFDAARRVEIVLSSENPIDPLPKDEISRQSQAGIRAWMSGSGLGGN